MSKGKKKPQKGKGVKLSDAILQYNVKNYTGALTRLKAAVLKPGEEQQAKNLQYALTLRLAFAEITAHNYRKAIQLLQPLLPHDPIAASFAGVAHLYLSEYTLANPLLKSAAKSYPSFAFYQLLSEIYQQKEIDFEGFIRFFSTEWNHCSDSQKQYIQIIICVFDDRIEDAKVIVESLKNQSHFQHINFDAFKRIFIPSSESTENLSEKVKPLYRLLLNEALADSEKAYFKDLDKEIGVLSTLLESQNKLNLSLQKEIAAQYNEQKVLHEAILAQLMQASSAEQRPYIAYNQAVNAFNQNDFDIAESGIKHVIVKYADDFALIPESLPLYLNFYQNQDFKVYPNTFWTFVKKWLSVRKENLSVENLDAMGWLIFDAIVVHATLIDRPYNHELVKILNEAPSVFALKFTQILFPNNQVAPNLVTDSRLELFSLPNAEKSKVRFADNFKKFMSLLSPYGGKFSIYDDEGIPKSLFTQQIAYYGECFMEAVKRHPIPPQNLIALESFKMIHEQVKIIIDQNKSPFPAGFYDRFMDAYKELLTRFPQNEATEIYKRDIQSAEYNQYLSKLKELTRYVSSSGNFLKFLKTLPKTTDYNFIWEHFGNLIDDVHFSESLAECLSNFIEALFVHQKNEAASMKEIDRFIKIYKNVIKTFDCEHPTTFYALLIKFILKRKTINSNIIYYFCIQYIEELTLKYKLEAKQYNAVADFLTWIKSSNYHLAARYNAPLTQKLKNYLVEVNKIKKLKGLDATIRTFASFT